MAFKRRILILFFVFLVCSLFELTNQDRLAHNLPSFILDVDERAMARATSQSSTYPLDHSNFIVSITGLPYSITGENLTRSSSHTTMDIIESALMQSPMHQRNILDPRFTHMAIGSYTSYGMTTIAEEFSD